MLVKTGNFKDFGAKVCGDEIIITFAVSKETKKTVLHVYDKSSEKSIKTVEVTDEFKMGRVCSISLSGVDYKKICYLIEEDGKLSLDPYATEVVGREKWGDASRVEVGFKVYSGIADVNASWNDTAVKVAPKDMVIYKLHMRGFTMNHGLSKGMQGNHLGLIKLIPYIKELGVTSVELMPVYDFEDQFHESHTSISPKGEKVVEEVALNKTNYWGYGDALYMAPKASYFKNETPLNGLRTLVSEFHKAGIEVILEFAFTDKCTDEYIVDVLKYYVNVYHIDGFHLIGIVPVEKIAMNPYLDGTKLFFEDASSELLCKETNKHIFIYNDAYTCVLRQIQNHMNGSMVQFANHSRRQNASYGFVNYGANVTGFTLLDSYSYGEKHNQDNGEDNRDGNNNSFSNNYGIEGKTNNKNVNRIRLLQVRNAIVSTLMTQGVPLINSGDECLNTCIGNNNPYCQDNKTGWVNFSKSKEALETLRFVKAIIEFRKNHKCVHPDTAMELNDFKSLGFPDMSYHGTEPWMMTIGEEQKALGILYNGAYATEDEDVYVCYNFGYDVVKLALPRLAPGKRWRMVINTADYTVDSDFVPKDIDNQETVDVAGGSISILVGTKVK